MSQRSQAQSAMGLMKDLLFTPITLPTIPGFGKPRKSGARRAAVRRRVEQKEKSALTFHLTGPLERGQSTKYSIGGEDIVIDENTWIFGEFRLGALANVKGERIGTQSFARKITIT